MDIFMVICSTAGHQVSKNRFNDYDQALDYATDQNEIKGYGVLILQLDYKTMKWQRRLVLYPYENC